MTTFISHTSAPEGNGRVPAFWFVFQDDKLWVRPHDGRVDLPAAAGAEALGFATVQQEYLGCLEDAAGEHIDCYAATAAPDAHLPEGWQADGLRGLAGQLGETLFGIAGRAVQILAWDRTHHFCGQCGAVTERMAHERAKQCPVCGLISYPRISPAIIIAVVRQTAAGPELLLGRNHRFPTGRYSVLAGFVEPGETLEECAQREVAEEVSIQIRNIRYFSSQPWPFPNSLMIGFTAEYDGGELRLADGELADARWFKADALPEIPPPTTIARRLIDWFVASGRSAG
ncbi:MAG TPA: NAD(+) diphosphatase [Anaerolineae bacterium]